MSFRTSVFGAAAGALVVFSSLAANATTLGFVSNPSSNSSDFAASVSALGATLNNGIDFEAMPLGALDNDFYLASDGVTITPTGDVNGVQFGIGPGQSNVGFAIPGEGSNPASNYVHMGASPSSLTFNFEQDVFGAGLFTIDAFSNSTFPLRLSIEAFTGVNGTGTSLGSFFSIQANFQRNGLYFMGLTSDIGFRSFVFSDLTDNGGDTFGIDNFVYATRIDPPAIPVPASLPLLMTALGAIGFAARRRKS